MGLYRNIGGFLDKSRSVGLSLYAPSLTLLDPPTTSILPSPFSDPVAYQTQQQATQGAYYTEMQNRYNWLMSHTLSEVKAAGYYVDQNDGSIFQWQDAEHIASTAYLPLGDIQRIENAAGTAGALLLHMQEPALAIDTAGYSGGSSATFYQEAGVDPTTQVTSAYPVTATTTPTTSTTATPATTHTTATATPLPTDLTTAIKNNVVPLATLAALTFVAIEGERVLGRKRKVAFVGGLGLLFYLMAKK